jgi:phosphoribosylformylglycinamidine synthase
MKPSLGGSSLAQVLNAIGNEVPDIRDAALFRDAFTAVQELISRGMVVAGHDISSGGMITTLLEMTFSQPDIGLDVSLDSQDEYGVIEQLFSENPGVVLQVDDLDFTSVFLHEKGVSFRVLGKPVPGRQLSVRALDYEIHFDIDQLRDKWFRTSYLLDRKQSGEIKAAERFTNYKTQERTFHYGNQFLGTFEQYAIDPSRRSPTGIKAAIIREKGSNGDREMAWALHLAGFDVKDVHMTDLVSGRETLEEVNLIVFVGGFSNSDVLGSAKGWAGAFLYNEKARESLEKFYARQDTLSLGVCNGCQLMVELGLLNPDHEAKPRMLHNDTHKYESSFLTVDIAENDTVMFGSLSGTRLGIWVAHGEGKFWFPYEESSYNIPAKFSFSDFPGNPNGSMFNAACLASDDGRHLAIMPHLERSVYPWQWGYYPAERKDDQITPWVEAFVNAREWIWEKL